jgi:cold shock CspA family protein
MFGTVKFYNVGNFGFITRNDGAGDVFVGARVVEASGLDLREGDLVEFEIGADRGGRPAVVEIERADR